MCVCVTIVAYTIIDVAEYSLAIEGNINGFVHVYSGCSFVCGGVGHGNHGNCVMSVFVFKLRVHRYIH